MRIVSRWRPLPAACVVLAAGAMAAPASADNAPVSTLTVGPATLQSGSQPAIAAPSSSQRVAINRPTMSMSDYKAAKAAAGRAPAGAKPAATPLNAPSAPAVPTAVGFQGVNQATSDGWFPSDVNGAVGGAFNVLTTNDRYVVYAKSTTKTEKKNVSLNTFFSYATRPFFDPRVVFDSHWNRFVVQAEAFEESGTVQVLALAVTKTASPTGATYNYLINGKQICGNDVFVDYPQISTTQDAVIETVNCFRNSDGAYLGARAIAVAKSILYNGKGFTVPVFAPSTNATATPPNVLDGNPRAHLLLGGGGTAVRDVSWQDPQSGFYSTMAAPVAMGTWFTPTFPPNARQGGCGATSCQLDTSDQRFVSPSTQVGDSLWNATTYALGSFAAPYWGEFDVEGAGADTTKQKGIRFLSGNSDDYNVSVVSGGDGRMFMNWTSSSPTAFISEVVAGRKLADSAGTLPVMLVPFTSSATLTGDFDANFGTQRWGDTSQITRDPASATTAWAWNQIAFDTNNWGTFTAKFVNP